MRKDILLPGLALAGGGLGFALRRWQLVSAFQSELGLFTRGAPATYALLAVTAGLFLMFFALLQGKSKKPTDFIPAFRCTQAGQMTVLAAAGLLFFAAGLLNLRDGAVQLQVWQLTSIEDRQSTQLTLTFLRLTQGALCLPSGAAVLLLGRAAYRESLPDPACLLAPFPAFAGLAWTLSAHMDNGTQPVLMRYGFLLFAAICFTLALYYVAGFLFNRPCPRRAAFFALAGVTLGGAALVDGLPLSTSALLLAFTLSSLGFAYGLLGNVFGPDRPEQPQDETPPVDDDGSD